jgi:hypothetical protein
LMGGRKPGRREHGSAEREWESEDGVLPFDHFESYAEIVKYEQRQFSVLSSQFTVQVA